MYFYYETEINMKKQENSIDIFLFSWYDISYNIITEMEEHIQWRLLRQSDSAASTATGIWACPIQQETESTASHIWAGEA